MTLFKWIWAVYFYHGWWKISPRQWAKHLSKKGRLVRLIRYEKLIEKNKKRGTPIHFIRCAVCNEKWHTTCKYPLCKKLSCWMAYFKNKEALYEAG